MEGIPNKQYGLILPKKNQPIVAPTLVKKPSVFAESDSEEETQEESPGDWMQKTLKKETFGGGYRSKQSKAEIQKILKEDATVYQYDEVYDDIQKKRQEVAAVKAAERVERKPRYIQHLMAAADKRKKENERRINRQVQKEREAEGDEFADKEVFVTASYKKKLEEMKAAEEEEKRQERLEAIGDVRKQGDLSGFYRHIYEKVVLNIDEETEVAVAPSQQKLKKREKQLTKSRQYRKRRSSESADEETDDVSAAKRPAESTEPTETHIKPANTQEESENSEPTLPKPKDLRTENPDADADSDSNSDSDESVKQEPGEEKKDEDENGKEDEEEKEEETIPEEPPKPKRSVWEKRTVGDVFDAALQRYYERKAARLVAVG